MTFHWTALEIVLRRSSREKINEDAHKGARVSVLVWRARFP